ncbi:hypothetical protein SEA_ACOLYTE_73 [Mycobacterium phage Acolyte]|nr:hypothetical protein SEA_ACOLYTE_73 [Mycobacterium phage Acolyte]
MQVTVWTVTVEYEDVLDTSVHRDYQSVMRELRERFDADHGQWEGDFTQAELDDLSDKDFQTVLNDYSVSNYAESHELEL